MHRRVFVGMILAAPVAVLAGCGGTTASDRNGTSTALAGGAPTPAPTTPPAAPAGTAPPANGAAAPAGGGDANTVNVEASDFKFVLNKSTVNAGAVRFVYRNAGPSPHNFIIQGNGVNQQSMIINMGQTEMVTANLRAGRYTYICNVPGHEQLGMKGEITVQ